MAQVTGGNIRGDASVGRIPDASLVTAALAGDRVAFASLVERHYGTAWAVAFSRLRKRNSADDLAQEVFLVALVHLGSLGDPARFGSWIRQIARNRAADWMRNQRRSSKLVAMVPVEELARAKAVIGKSSMEHEEESESVRAAVFALPELQQEIVLLRFGLGLSQTEIANRLDVHPATVGRQLERAIGAMRRTLGTSGRGSLQSLRPSQQTISHAALLVAAAAAMSAPARTAMAAAAGAAPVAVTASTGGTGLGSIMKGAILMTSSTKIGAAVTAAAVVMIGVGIHRWISAPSTPAAPAPLIAPSTDHVILAAANECYPPPIAHYLSGDVRSSAKLLDPQSRLPIYTQATSVDHDGNIWIGGPVTISADGSGNLDFGDTDALGPSGLVLDDGSFVPLVRTQEAWKLSDPTYRASAHVSDPTYRAAAHVTNWPAGMKKTILLITQRSQAGERVQATPTGEYPIEMSNRPGCNCIQQLAMIVAKGWELNSSSSTPTSKRVVGDYTVYLWQQRISRNTGYSVNASLRKS